MATNMDDAYKQNLANMERIMAGINAQRQANPNDVLYSPEPPKPQIVQPQAPAFDANAYYNDGAARLTETANRQRDLNLAQFRQARDKSVGEIGTLKNDANVAFQQNRDQTDFQSKVAANRLREMMAAQGLGNSGENVTGQVGINTANQNAMNALDLQQRRTIDDYDKELRDLYDPSKENNITEQSSIDLLNRLNQLQQTAADRAYDNSWRTADFDRAGAWHNDDITFRDKQAANEERWKNVANGWTAREWNSQQASKSLEDKIKALQLQQAQLELANAKKKVTSSGGSRSGGGSSRGYSGGSSSSSSTKNAYMQAVNNQEARFEYFRSKADINDEFTRNKAHIVQQVGPEGYQYLKQKIAALPDNFIGNIWADKHMTGRK